MYFTPHLEYLHKNCSENFTEIEISPYNKNFKYLDTERKIMVGKSEKYNQNYETIVFGCSDINSVSIPSNVKIIESDAFQRCSNLQKIRSLI